MLRYPFPPCDLNIILKEAEVALSIKDDVIYKLDTESFSGGLESGCNFGVHLAGREAASWVVVGYNDCRGTVSNWVGEDLPRVDLGFVDQAYGYGTNGYNLVGTI